MCSGSGVAAAHIEVSLCLYFFFSFPQCLAVLGMFLGVSTLRQRTCGSESVKDCSVVDLEKPSVVRYQLFFKMVDPRSVVDTSFFFFFQPAQAVVVMRRAFVQTWGVLRRTGNCLH